MCLGWWTETRRIALKLISGMAHSAHIERFLSLMSSAMSLVQDSLDDCPNYEKIIVPRWVILF